MELNITYNNINNGVLNITYNNINHGNHDEILFRLSSRALGSGKLKSRFANKMRIFD